MHVEDDEIAAAEADPYVPTELLELYVALDEANVSPEAFKEVYGETGSSE